MRLHFISVACAIFWDPRTATAQGITCQDAVTWLTSIGTSCPAACDDGETCLIDDGGNCCESGQSPCAADTCGTEACAEFMSVDDAALAACEEGLASCEDGFLMSGQLRALLVLIAPMCGVATGLTATHCDQGTAVVLNFETACPRVCSEDGEALPQCGEDQCERTPGSCALSGEGACASFLDDFLDGAEKFVENIGTCTNGLEVCAQMGADSLREMAGSMERQCESEQSYGDDDDDDACGAAHEAAVLTEGCHSCTKEPESCDDFATLTSEGGCAHGCTVAGGADESIYQACIEPFAQCLGC